MSQLTNIPTTPQDITTEHSYFPATKTLKCLTCGASFAPINIEDIEKVCADHIPSCNTSGVVLKTQP
jgi:hypothetical protein